MKNLFLALLFIVPFATFAQTNYSGTWSLNASKSDLGNDDPGKAAPQQFKIEQDNKQLKLYRTLSNGSVRTEVYLLDGTPKDASISATSTMTTNVKWSEDKKQVTLLGVYHLENNGVKYDMNRTDLYILSDDGKILTVKRTAVLPDRTETVKAVYDRQ